MSDRHHLQIGEASENVAFITSGDTGYDVAVIRREVDSIPHAQRLNAEEWQALIDTINETLKKQKP